MKSIRRRPFTIFSSVISALFLREIQTRFGTQKLGYLWAVLDPMSQVIAFSVIKSAIADSSMPGVDYPVFLATGFLTYNFFRAVMMNSMYAFDANRALFNYRQVKPIDTIVSRFLVEFLIMSVAVGIFVLFGLYIGLDVTVENLAMVLFAVAWLGAFGFSLGILFAVVGVFYETFKKIISFISTPMFFLSGLLYTVDSLPPLGRELILYNPVIHFIEMIHGNYFSVMNTQYVDYMYMTYWTLVPLFLGLFFYLKSERKIIAS